MFRHVVLMRWKPDATQRERAAVVDALRKLPGLIPELRHYSVGADARVNEGNYDLAVVADCVDVDAYFVYRDHPDHQAAIAEHIRPILADRVAVQYQM
jgi:hypothetical protein